MHFGRWRHARGREHYHGEPGSALSGELCTRFSEGGRQLDRRRVRGVLNLCVRIKGANREISEGKADL